jgi:hypothetical protein
MWWEWLPPKWNGDTLLSMRCRLEWNCESLEERFEFLKLINLKSSIKVFNCVV